MKHCAMAGAPCPNEATITVRIAYVGDRALCQPDYETMVALGMPMRVLSPDEFVPAWRTRSLLRDDTGRVLNVRAVAR